MGEEILMRSCDTILHPTHTPPDGGADIRRMCMGPTAVGGAGGGETVITATL